MFAAPCCAGNAGYLHKASLRSSKLPPGTDADVARPAQLCWSWVLFPVECVNGLVIKIDHREVGDAFVSLFSARL